MSKLERKIAIIGGGLAGPALALCLKQKGIDSIVYEFRPADYHIGKNIAMAGNANRVLDHLGIYSDLRTAGFSFEKMGLCNSYGTVLATLSQGDPKTWGMPSLRIRRSTVRQKLLQTLKAHNIEVIYGKKLAKIEEGDESVKLFFTDGETAEANIVVGADGIHSVVREAVHGPYEPIYFGTVHFYGMVKRDMFEAKFGKKTQLPKTCTIFGKEGAIMIQPPDFAGDEISYVVNIELPDRSKEEWQKLDEDKHELKRILTKTFAAAHWNEEIKILIRETPLDQLSTWKIENVPHASKWTSSLGSLILIGDAAHSFPPTGGQGAAMALEDAETLAYALANIDDRSSALQKWEVHRQSRVKEVLAFNNLTAKLKEAAPNWFFQVLKELLIRILLKVKGPEGYKWLYGYDGKQVMDNL